MKSQVCINTDKVTVIYLNKEFKSAYKFYPAEEPRQKYICRWLNQIYPFSAIPFGKTKAKPERWSQGNPKYSYDENEYIMKDERYKVVGEGDDRILMVKAKATIYLGRSEYVTLYFESDEEARTIINNTVSLTKNPIQTIELD